MKRIVKLALVLLFGLIWVNDGGAQESTFPVLQGPYFGQKMPGLRAQMFAPGIVSSEHHDDGSPVFTPDGRECFWRTNGQYDGANRTGFIFWSREENGRWSQPRLAPFASSTGGQWGLSMQPDGSRLYYWSKVSTTGEGHSTGSPWFVTRTPSGWSGPQPLVLPIDHTRVNGYFSVGDDGSLYFTLESSSKDSAGTAVVRLRPDGNRFAPPEDFGTVPTGAGQRVAVPSFSKDGNTLVFTSADESRLFLMVCFRRANGAWTTPVILGDNINAGSQTKFAGFSTDGRVLFLVSNREPDHANPMKVWKTDLFRGPQKAPLCDVWWVEARALDTLRATAR